MEKFLRPRVFRSSLVLKSVFRVPFATNDMPYNLSTGDNQDMILKNF